MMEGLVHVYTGTGKGKTTSSLGLALRSVGHNMKAYMIQFMKSGDTGEMFAIQKYVPNIKIAQFGKDALDEKQTKIVGYEKKEEKHRKNELGDDEVYVFLPDEEEREASRRGLEFAKNIVMKGDTDIVILDEINCVLDRKLVSLDDVLDLIKNKPKHVELIMTGRGAPKALIDAADYVSEIKRIKHPYDTKGVLARKGIEY
jgi:cob(I)alamin adenosyltransferase